MCDSVHVDSLVCKVRRLYLPLAGCSEHPHVQGVSGLAALAVRKICRLIILVGRYLSMYVLTPDPSENDIHKQIAGEM